MRLLTKTSSQWLDVVLSDFNSFLIDHAACERKASATALSLLAHFPDRDYLVSAMIELAVEELQHFQQVYALMEKRGLRLAADEKDPYVQQLLKLVRSSKETYLLDRLLIAGVVEARGCERFGILADGLTDAELKQFYMDITRSEARHHGLFVRIAIQYYDEETVESRLGAMLMAEAQIVQGLTLRPAVH